MTAQQRLAQSCMEDIGPVSTAIGAILTEKNCMRQRIRVGAHMKYEKVLLYVHDGTLCNTRLLQSIPPASEDDRGVNN